MATRAAYPSDLTDKLWTEVESLIPAAEPGGWDQEVDMREVLNGILYLVRGGVNWRMLPHDLPPWGMVQGRIQTVPLPIFASAAAETGVKTTRRDVGCTVCQ